MDFATSQSSHSNADEEEYLETEREDSIDLEAEGGTTEATEGEAPENEAPDGKATEGEGKEETEGKVGEATDATSDTLFSFQKKIINK